MRHGVFISHCRADSAVALDVCRRIEARGVRCWIAPRDISPGSSWSQSVIDAIEHSRGFVIILSSNANASDFVSSEAEIAFTKKLPIFPLRTEDVAAGRGLKLFVNAAQWTDAYGPRAHDATERFCEAVARKVLRDKDFAPGRITPKVDWSAFARVIGPGSAEFIAQWQRMAANGQRHAWSWEAFIGGPIWPFYRGIIPLGIVLVGLVMLGTMAGGAVIGDGLGLVFGFILGWFAVAVIAGWMGSRALRQHANDLIARGRQPSPFVNGAAMIGGVGAIAGTLILSDPGAQEPKAAVVATTAPQPPDPLATPALKADRTPREGVRDPIMEERKRQHEIVTGVIVGYQLRKEEEEKAASADNMTDAMATNDTMTP